MSECGVALLIDGRNTAYRAVFGSFSHPDTAAIHPFTIWLRCANAWISKFKPSSVHVFWDCPKAQVWRRKLLIEYKDNRGDFEVGGKHHDATDALFKMEQAANDILPLMNVRSYARDTQEADDLIYSACKVLAPNRVVVVSNDSDMLQIPWMMSHVKCYDPLRSELMSIPDTSPVLQKALMGDSTDNISGYRGIGPVKSRELIRDPKILMEFIKLRGEQEFKRNLALVDLSLNPMRLNNELYVMQVMGQPIEFNQKAIHDKIMMHKISGLNADFARVVIPFKFIKPPERPQT